jgi:hypothetical protein
VHCERVRAAVFFEGAMMVRRVGWGAVVSRESRVQPAFAAVRRRRGHMPVRAADVYRFAVLGADRVLDDREVDRAAKLKRHAARHDDVGRQTREQSSS